MMVVLGVIAIRFEIEVKRANMVLYSATFFHFTRVSSTFDFWHRALNGMSLKVGCHN